MTDDEKRQQKAMLLLEFHEAEQNLAHLTEKARKTSLRIRAVSDWLNQAPQETSNPNIVNVPQLGSVNIIEDPLIEHCMDFQKVSSLVYEIVEVRHQLKDMQKRKEALGLK